MDFSTLSISNTLSKDSVDEEMSMFRASMEDARSRLADGIEPETISNERIQKGEEILETYRVTSDAIYGGMGSVWRVHHRNWNVELAMKRPLPRFFAEGSGKRKENFIRECESWIRLGLYPNIVSCYYVREIGGVPTIFSEWMDGGSLKDRIEDGTLYADSKKVVQARLLDIAIQFARGLHYSHESKDHLIHQDVKPSNLMLSKHWDAKVADFGLAKSLTFSESGKEAPAGGYTPAYCSPEQFAGEPLTRLTDIYSWAVSVLEMYLGKRLWRSGVEAGRNCKEYFGRARVCIPARLEELLSQCLSEDPAGRPRDFAVVEERLREIYFDTVGEDYSRSAPEELEGAAPTLNNMALSMLDLGKEDAAEELWKQALELSPDFEYAVYNQLVHWWYGGKIDDIQVMTRLKELDKNVMSKESSQALAAASRSRGSDVFVLAEKMDPKGDKSEAREILARSRAPWIYLDADYCRFAAAGSEFADRSGKHLISVTNKYVQVRDRATSETLAQMGGVAGPGMTAGAFYKDEERTLLVWGRTPYSGSNSFMRLYDMRTGRCIRTLMPGLSEEFEGESAEDNRLDLACISADGSRYYYPDAKLRRLMYRRPDFSSPDAEWLLCRIVSYDDSVAKKRRLENLIPEIRDDLAQKKISAAYEKIGEAYGLLEGEYNEELVELNRTAGEYGRICGLRGVYPAPADNSRKDRDKPRGETHSYFSHYFPTNEYGRGILLDIDQKSNPIALSFYRVSDSKEFFGHGTAKEEAKKRSGRLFTVRLKRGEKISEDIVLSPDHSTFYCRIDGNLCMINGEGKLVRSGKPLGRIYCISPDGTQLATGDGHELSICSIPEGKITRSCPLDAASTENLDRLAHFSDVKSGKGYFREDGRAVFIEIGSSLIMVSLEDNKQYFIGKKDDKWLIDYEYELCH